MQTTESIFELADGTLSLAASGVGALATAAQTGAAGAHAIADVTDAIGGVLFGGGGARYRGPRPPRMITGGGGGDPGDDYPPPGDVEPPLPIEDRPLPIEDGRASSSEEEVVPRPALPMQDEEPDEPIAVVPQPEFFRRSSHRATSSTQRSDMAYGSSAPTRAAGPGLGTRWVGHRGPGGWANSLSP